MNIFVKQSDRFKKIRENRIWEFVMQQLIYLAHVIEQPNLRIPNPQYLQLNFCFDFFNDSENTF